MAAVDDTTQSTDAPADGDSSSVGLYERLKNRLPEKLKNRLPDDWKQFFQSRRNIVITAITVSVASFGVLWLIGGEEELSPGDKIQHAIELLADHDNLEDRQKAKDIATRLSESGQLDEEDEGLPEFVLGIVAFRDAQDRTSGSGDGEYKDPVKQLRIAERTGLDQKYWPEFHYALGVSLYNTGENASAARHLTEAIKTYPVGRVEASVQLAELYLDRPIPAELREALNLVESALKTPGLSDGKRDQILLKKARLHIALNENSQARLVLKQVSNVTAVGHVTIVFRAQSLMAEAESLVLSADMPSISPTEEKLLRERAVRQFTQASRDLTPVATAKGLNTTFPRQALLLKGICAQRIAELDRGNNSVIRFDLAINFFSRTVQRFKGSQEATAAGVRLGDLLQRSGRSEESLRAYKKALGSFSDPANYRNRWLSLTEFREKILEAWNDWTFRHAYQEAADLAEMMSPLIPSRRSRELSASAHAKWAEKLTRELSRTPFQDREKKKQQIQSLWRASGEARAQLATSQIATSSYLDLLLVSAEHFRRGHAFDKALDQLTKFINKRPKKKLALAIVLRAGVLMDLDRFKEAREQFQHVIDAHATEHPAFQAQYDIGRCHLELGNTAAAETTWRNLRASDQLTPDATEWRRSLFSLGKLLFHTAVLTYDDAQRTQTDTDEKQYLEKLERASARWEESRRLLGEFLERYPQSPDTIEAQFLFAKSLQYSAQKPRALLRNAETENVRVELRRDMHRLLRLAQDEFSDLQSQLLRHEESELLDLLGQNFLRDCYFEIAHTFFALGDYPKAIRDYNAAANRYSQTPQVLLAYLQLANCYDKRGKPGDGREALSALVQATVILKQLPDAAFDSTKTNLTRKEWAEWLDWARKLRGNVRTPPRLLSPSTGAS